MQVPSFVFGLLFLVVLGAPRVAGAAQEEDATIQIKPVVEVDGTNSEITFGDLLVVHGMNENELSSVRAVRLADTPKAGESRSFTGVGIEDIFRPYLKAIEDRIGMKVVLRVPQRVTVTRKVFRLHAQDVESEMRAQLGNLCADCQFEISDLRLPIITQSAGMATATAWTLKMRQELPKGGFSIPLEIRNEDGSKRTYWVNGTLATRRMVPVATRALSFGEKFHPDDFAMELKEITFATDIFASPLDLASSVAGRQFAAGQIIWRGGLKREMAIKAGDSVKVMAGGDTWQISIDGIAQGTGYVGDLVRVKIPRTSKTISGLLKEKGLVVVE